ncbi:MAG: HEAT repeat domain-containing protein [Snowella sp.]|nr:HEAT repeat domain-containing protein [Snowella sp.]
MVQQLNPTQLVVHTLSNKLDDSSPQIRAKAAESLGKIGDRMATDTLLNHLHEETDLETRRTIIQALGQIGQESAIPYLALFLADINPSIRIAATESIGKIGTEKAVSYLVQSLTDEEPQVRAIAATALGEIGTEETLPPLSHACSDADDNVRLSAVEALGKIGHRYAIN